MRSVFPCSTTDTLCVSVDVRCLCKHAVETLHDQLRDCVDLMGIGLGASRADTVAEEGTTITKDQPKDVGDVRSAPPTSQGHVEKGIQDYNFQR